MYDLPPLSLRVTLLFVACIRVAFECQRWKRDEVVAQQWDMCYVVQFYVDPSVVRVKSYGKFIVISYGGCSPVRKTYGSTTLSVVGLDRRRLASWCMLTRYKRCIARPACLVLHPRFLPQPSHGCFLRHERLSFHGEILFCHL